MLCLVNVSDAVGTNRDRSGDVDTARRVPVVSSATLNIILKAVNPHTGRGAYRRNRGLTVTVHVVYLVCTP